MSLPETVRKIQDSECSLCPDLVSVRKQIVVARGYTGADVAIVGQNPGAQEDECGRPFTGRAGQLLDDIIRSLGYVPDEEFFFTNVVLCHTENNIQPTSRHISNCSVHLGRTLKKFKKVVAIGKTAALGVMRLLDPEVASRYDSGTPMGSLITKGAPRTLGVGEDSKHLFITYHTSYLLRSGVTADSEDHKLFRTVRSEIQAAKECEIHDFSNSDLADLEMGLY